MLVFTEILLDIPVVVDVVYREKEFVERKKKVAKLKPKANIKSKKVVEKALSNAGYQPQVEVNAIVMDYDQHCEAKRCKLASDYIFCDNNHVAAVVIGLSADQHKPEVVNGEKFLISTVFEEGSYLTAGVLVFPPGVQKPNRNSAKHALVFYVISGVFEVTIHHTSFVIGTGGQFIVPRGNHYQITSLPDEEGRLHFCHCKDTAA